MGNSRKLKRNLNEKQVWIAKTVEQKRNELAKAIVKERIEKDAEFAKDVLKAVGSDLPQDFKEAAEKTIAEEKQV